MEELRKAIETSSIRQSVSLLPQALEQEEVGIDFLIECLDNSELEIRARAYQLLQDIELDQAKKEIAPGLLFNPGDKLYYVFSRSIWFGDSFGHLYPKKEESNVSHLSTYQDYISNGYKIIRFAEAAYITSNITYYLNYQQAQAKAELLHTQNILKISLSEFDLDQNCELIKQWCDRYDITQEIIDYEREKMLKKGWDKWCKMHDMPDPWEQIYWFTVEEYLKNISILDLLGKLWQDLLGNLAYVKEIYFEKKTYLSIDPYYSQIIKISENVSQHYIGENEEELSSEDSEIRVLLTALNDDNLAKRFLAYQLLHGFKCESAQQAISQGIKLNPEDKIYSVYQCGIGFDDQEYYLLPDHIDYYQQIYLQVEGSYLDRPKVYAQRKYCFIDREQAEAAAETLHCNLTKGDRYLSDWCKENPDFNVKQWCANNNIAYEDRWDECKISLDGSNSFTAILAVEILIADNKHLADNFRRSRYIYHRQHIDVWCKDNGIDYKQICQNSTDEYWVICSKVLDYLELPENIELLSKFWKDGIGNLAFIKEEIVLKQVHIKIGKELEAQTEAKKLYAVPEEEREAVGELLVGILCSDHNQNKSKATARKILQELDWNGIPF